MFKGSILATIRFANFFTPVAKALAKAKFDKIECPLYPRTDRGGLMQEKVYNGHGPKAIVTSKLIKTATKKVVGLTCTELFLFEI